MKSKGTKEVLRELRRLRSKFPGAFAASLYQEGLAVDALAVRRVPVETGRLRGTHYVSPPEAKGRHGVEVEAGFATEYGVYVHENRSARHVVGTAFYLLSALAERAPGFFARLARRVEANARAKVSFGGALAGVPPAPEDLGKEWQKAKRRQTRRKRNR